MRKFILLIVAILLLAVVGTGIWAYYEYLYTKPLTKTELAELTPDWTKVTHGNWSPWITEPDGTKTWNPGASFNAFLNTVPDDNKAWPVLINTHYSHSGLMDRKLTRSEPGSVEWEQLRSRFESSEVRETALGVSDAFCRQFLGEGFSDSTSVTEHNARLANGLSDNEWNSNPNPNPLLCRRAGLYMHKHLDLVYFVTAFAKLELIKGDPDSFVSLAESVLISSSLVSERLALVNYTMRNIVVKECLELLAWSLNHYSAEFTDRHLVQIDDLLAEAELSYDMFTGPLLVYHDLLRRMVSVDGEMDANVARQTHDGISVPSSVPDSSLDHELQRMLYEANYYHRLAQSVIDDNKSYEHGEIAAVFDDRRHLVGYKIEKLLELESYAFDMAIQRRSESYELAKDLRFSVAMIRHALRHGSPPASQSDIDHDLLPD